MLLDGRSSGLSLADVLSKNYGNVTLSDARFLNISILVEGKEYEPKAPVQVRIEYIEPVCTEDTVDYGYDVITGEKVVPKEKENRFVAVHYTDDGADLIDSENTSGEEGLTETIYDVDGISEYDLVYMYDYDSYEAVSIRKSGSRCTKTIDKLDYYSCTEKMDGTHLDDYEPI